MQAVSALIDFLMSLMHDDDAKASFEADPEGTMAARGLSGVTGQDVRDARLIMSDGGGLQPRGHGHASSSHHADPVREIHHTTSHFELRDQTFNFVKVDDRDTLINDSFNDSTDNSVDNSENHVVAIQDNDTTDIDVVKVEDSFNDKEPTAETPAPAGEEPAGTGEPAEDVPVGEEPAEGEPFDEPAEDPFAEDPAATNPPPVEHELIEGEADLGGEPDQVIHV
jgi:hypothetical protein